VGPICRETGERVVAFLMGPGNPVRSRFIRNAAPTLREMFSGQPTSLFPRLIGKLRRFVIRRLWHRWESEEAKLNERMRAEVGGKYTSYLRGVNFSGALLSGAKLDRAFLCESDLSGSCCDGTSFGGADLRKVNFAKAHMLRANFRFADLQDATLSRTGLFGSDFSFALLKGADFHNCHAAETNFEGADLGMSGGEEIDLSERKLDEFRFIRTCLERASFTRANFSGAYLVDVRAADCSFHDANLRNADLSEIDLKNAILSGADARGIVLRNANLEGVNVYGVRFDRAGQFNGVRLTNCFGSVRFERFVRDQAFLEELASARGWTRALYYCWLILADCGRTPWAWLAWCAGVIVVFGSLYSGMPPWLPEDLRPEIANVGRTSFSPYYFSLVTFTTLGFGDLHPTNLVGEIIVAIEVILGYVMLGGLISIIATIVGRRA
jgi:uncharacterized protein YjbI with pentapeptide repeats